MLLRFLFLTTIIAQNHSASQVKNLFFLKKNRPSRGGLLCPSTVYFRYDLVENFFKPIAQSCQSLFNFV